MRIAYGRAIDANDVLGLLAEFDPHVAGTPPLGIDVDTSDIDILCAFTDPLAFTNAVVLSFQDAEGFTIRQWRSGKRAVVAQFRSSGWQFEIFGEETPVERQEAWLHFLVERRLLRLGGDGLRAEIVRQKQNGLKTEPAFGWVLGLDGNAYQALLELEQKSDEDLSVVLRNAGFRC